MTYKKGQRKSFSQPLLWLRKNHFAILYIFAVIDLYINQMENLSCTRGQKKRKRTRESPKKATPGAFWVLEGIEEGEDG